MDFTPEHHLAIAKAIVDLIYHSGNSNLSEKKRSRKGSKFEDTSMTFYESYVRGLPSIPINLCTYQLASGTSN